MSVQVHPNNIMPREASGVQGLGYRRSHCGTNNPQALNAYCRTLYYGYIWSLGAGWLPIKPPPPVTKTLCPCQSMVLFYILNLQ